MNGTCGEEKSLQKLRQDIKIREWSYDSYHILGNQQNTSLLSARLQEPFDCQRDIRVRNVNTLTALPVLQSFCHHSPKTELYFSHFLPSVWQKCTMIGSIDSSNHPSRQAPLLLLQHLWSCFIPVWIQDLYINYSLLKGCLGVSSESCRSCWWTLGSAWTTNWKSWIQQTYSQLSKTAAAENVSLNLVEESEFTVAKTGFQSPVSL